MIRIRRIIDDLTPIDRKEILQVQVILREQFPLLPEADIQNLPEMLLNPFKFQFRSLLFVADDIKGNVKGFALLLHAPVLRFCYLDFISTSKKMMGGGIGGALYERVREEAKALNVLGIFFECLPDDPRLCQVSQEILRDNASRLRFYEGYGAYPIINTAYETPIKPTDVCPPYLVFDDLGQGIPLRREVARAVVRAILERKYGVSCPPGYIDMVGASIADDPIRLREPRYIKPESIHAAVKHGIPPDRRISLVVSDSHSIHHIHERGYVESPVRIDTILREIERTDLFEREHIRTFSEEFIRQVHDGQFVNYFKKVCASLGPDESVYPYVFPLRNAARPPVDLPTRAGYFCIDTFTPLNRNAYPAAKRDPTGNWPLRARDFETNGRLIGRLKLPTLIVQEGGYNTRNLGLNARHFFHGLWSGYYRL
ncbi:MAG: hypothetical protein QHH14_12610 [Clostridiales bacterium]|nr:hypothetical protein [Clostridiales bacterium]